MNNYDLGNLYPTLDVGQSYVSQEWNNNSARPPSYESVLVVDEYKKIAIESAQEIKDIKPLELKTVRSAFDKYEVKVSTLFQIAELIEFLTPAVFVLLGGTSLFIAAGIALATLLSSTAAVVAVAVVLAASVVFFGSTAVMRFASPFNPLFLAYDPRLLTQNERDVANRILSVDSFFQTALCNFRLADEKAKELGIDLSSDSNYRQLRERIFNYEEFTDKLGPYYQSALILVLGMNSEIREDYGQKSQLKNPCQMMYIGHSDRIHTVIDQAQYQKTVTWFSF